MVSQEFDMANQIKLERASRIIVGQCGCAPALDPKTIPTVFETREISISCRVLSHVNDSLSDRVPWDSRKDLFQSGPVQSDPVSTASSDDRTCVFGQFIIIAVPLESVPPDQFLLFLLLLLRLLLSRLIFRGYKYALSMAIADHSPEAALFFFLILVVCRRTMGGPCWVIRSSIGFSGALDTIRRG